VTAPASPQQCPRCGLVYGSPRAQCALDGEALQPLGAVDRLVGRTVGPYRVDALLAAGRSHRLYRAEDPALRRTVALKVLHGELAADAALKKSYLITASLAEVRDPELFVHVLDARTSDEGLVLVALELGAGRTLAAALAAGESFAPDVVARWGVALASGLHGLHKKGRALGAVEPRAVWLDEQGGVTRARWLDVTLGELGRVRAEVGYAAPEAGAPTAAGDLYALGATLRAAVGRGDAGALSPVLALLAGATPGERPSAVQVIERLTTVAGVAMPSLASTRPRRADSVRPTKAESTRPSKAEASLRPGKSEASRAMDLALARAGEAAPEPAPSRGRGRLVGAVVVVGALAAGGYALRGQGPSTAPSPSPVPSAAPVAAVAPVDTASITLGAADAGVAEADAAVVVAEGRADAGRRSDAGRAAAVAAGGADAAPRVEAVARRIAPVDPGLVPAPQSPARLRFEECDRQLGRALKTSGHDFAHLEAREPEHARRWARWYKNPDAVEASEVEAACSALLAAAAQPS
jgi:hypothetical protein